MESTSEFPILLALLGGVWGAFGIITKVFEALNERRDLVLQITEGSERLKVSHRRRLALSDWLPLWLGSVFFLLVMTCFFLVLAGVRPSGGLDGRSHSFVTAWLRANLDATPTEALCYLSAAFAGFGFLANLIGGLWDFADMLRSVNTKPRGRQSVTRQSPDHSRKRRQAVVD